MRQVPGRHCLPWPGEGVGLDWVALFMTHAFWDQPCPPGGTFQEGSLWPPLPCAGVRGSAVPACPGQEKARQRPPGRGASLGWGTFFLDGELPSALLAT